jgi:hypothetical protein
MSYCNGQRWRPLNLMTQMHSGYRHHRRIGALPDDLNAFDGSIVAGDTYLSGGDTAGAITAYQAAGNTGAVTIGPEIDASTGGSSQPLTQQAWNLNGQLAAITPSTSFTDAQNAQSIVKQMQNLYHTAIRQGSTPSPPPPNLPPPPAPGGGGGSGGGGGGGGGGSGTVVLPPTTITPSTPIQAGVFPWGTAALITSAVVAAGYIAYESKHGKHLMRHAGHHARRLHHGLKHRLLRRRHA